MKTTLEVSPSETLLLTDAPIWLRQVLPLFFSNWEGTCYWNIERCTGKRIVSLLSECHWISYLWGYFYL